MAPTRPTSTVASFDVAKKPTLKIPFRVRKRRDGMLNPKPRGDYIAISKRNSRESPLLKLPSEIRNKIYHYAFEKQADIVLIGRELEKYPGRLGCVGKPSTNLLKACRQIYYEAALLPVSLNFFHVMNRNTLERVAEDFALGQRRSIKQLTVTVEAVEFFWKNKRATRFGNLEKLIVWYTPSQWWIPTCQCRMAENIRLNMENESLEIIFKESQPVPVVSRKLHPKQLLRIQLMWLSERMFSRE